MEGLNEPLLSELAARKKSGLPLTLRGASGLDGVAALDQVETIAFLSTLEGPFGSVDLSKEPRSQGL